MDRKSYRSCFRGLVLIWELEKVVWGWVRAPCGWPSVIQHLRGEEPSHIHSLGVNRAAECEEADQTGATAQAISPVLSCWAGGGQKCWNELLNRRKPHDWEAEESCFQRPSKAESTEINHLSQIEGRSQGDWAFQSVVERWCWPWRMEKSERIWFGFFFFLFQGCWVPDIVRYCGDIVRLQEERLLSSGTRTERVWGQLQKAMVEAGRMGTSPRAEVLKL